MTLEVLTSPLYLRVVTCRDVSHGDDSSSSVDSDGADGGNSGMRLLKLTLADAAGREHEAIERASLSFFPQPGDELQLSSCARHAAGLFLLEADSCVMMRRGAAEQLCYVRQWP